MDIFRNLYFRGAGGGGMFGDVNISAILDSLSVSYDKRVRPNYGGLFNLFLFNNLLFHIILLFLCLALRFVIGINLLKRRL